jgi:hypothetical protein
MLLDIIVRRNTKISSSILLSFSINTYLYNMVLSEETLRYLPAYFCFYPLIHTCIINIILYRYVLMDKNKNMLVDILVFSSNDMILYRYLLMVMDNNMMLDIFVFHLTISYWIGMYYWRTITCWLLSFSIKTYLYNMILSEQTQRYPAASYCSSPLIHTCTVLYCQTKH